MQPILKTSFSIIAIVFLITGCSLSFSLKRFDQKLGEIFFNEKPAAHDVSSVEKPFEKEGSMPAGGNKLTADQKRKIDAWLEENGFNRYGDPADMLYLGGSPLFDEATGESKERYEYILEKVPDVLEKIEL